MSFSGEGDRLEMRVGGQPVGVYVFQDPKVPRPYFMHLRGPGGVQLTRNFPPIVGKDSDDHADMHPGLWLSFAELGAGAGYRDYWRNKVPTVHEKFADEPRGGPGRGSFTVVNRYAADDKGEGTICCETCKVTLLVRPAGYLLVIDSVFRSDDADFAFGDTEEMGLGLRVNSVMEVKRGAGGRILNSEGGRDEAGVWGKEADWCDYSGTVDGEPAGVMLVPDPEVNFRRSRFHARDYGLLVANPFGRKAFGAGEASRVEVKKGEDFRLRFGVLLHAGEGMDAERLKAAYEDCVKAMGE